MTLPIRIDSQANTPQRWRRNAQLLKPLLAAALPAGPAGTVQLSNGSGGFEAGPPITSLESAGTVDEVQLSDGSGGFIVGSQPLTLTSGGSSLTLSTSANDFIVAGNQEFLVTMSDYPYGVLQTLPGAAVSMGDVAYTGNGTIIAVNDNLATIVLSALNDLALFSASSLEITANNNIDLAATAGVLISAGLEVQGGQSIASPPAYGTAVVGDILYTPTGWGGSGFLFTNTSMGSHLFSLVYNADTAFFGMADLGESFLSITASSYEPGTTGVTTVGQLYVNGYTIPMTSPPAYGASILGLVSYPAWGGTGFVFANATAGSHAFSLIYNADTAYFGLADSGTPWLVLDASTAYTAGVAGVASVGTLAVGGDLIYPSGGILQVQDSAGNPVLQFNSLFFPHVAVSADLIMQTNALVMNNGTVLQFDADDIMAFDYSPSGSPVNTITPVGWIQITVNGTSSYLPYYQ